MVQFKNYTPHEVCLNNGTKFQSLGIARVGNSFTNFDNNLCCSVKYGEVEGLPAPENGVILIVSAMVLAASNRDDLVAPATGHPDTIRNEKGQIISVPGFVQTNISV